MSLDREDGVVGYGEIGYARIGNVSENESVQLQAGNSTTRILSRLLSAGVGVTDQFTRVIDYKRVVTENISLQDIVDAPVTILVTATENFSLNTSVSKTGTFKRKVNEAIGIGTKFINESDILRFTLKAGIGFSDNVSRTVTKLRTVKEVFGVSTGVQDAKTKVLVLSENLGLGINRFNWLNSLAGTVGITERDDTENSIYEEDENKRQVSKEVHVD